MSIEDAKQSTLAHILRLRAPWMVKAHRFDSKKKQLDIWVAASTEQTGWLRGKRRVFLEGPEHSWRHLDIAGWQTYVHVRAPDSYSLDGLVCAGDPGEPFSRAMTKFLFELLYNGVELGAICSLFGISFDQLWRFKFALDNGRIRIDTAPAVHSEGSHSAVPTLRDSVPTVQETSVPDPSDPVWTRLAVGDLNLDIRVLSLKLLLTRVRSQMAMIQDENVRELKVAELYRYFAKNARTLTHELSQFREPAR